MAIPPDPIEDVLPLAAWVVEAEVAEVLSTGPTPPQREARRGATSVGNRAPSQSVRLSVTRVLRGKRTKELIVDKPEAGYLLKAGDHGPFLIDANSQLLGAYGPDTYSLAEVTRALG